MTEPPFLEGPSFPAEPGSVLSKKLKDACRKVGSWISKGLPEIMEGGLSV